MELEPAYVLHTRPYRDTSALIDVLTPYHGRVTLSGRGVRSQTSTKRAFLQPFTPLYIAWRGDGDLVTLTHIEPNGALYPLDRSALFCGLYLNELLYRVTPRFDPFPELYAHCQQILLDMLDGKPLEPLLRHFEFHLLEELGFGVDLDIPFEEGVFYYFLPEEGFLGAEGAPISHCFKGEHLKMIRKGDYSSPSVLQAAKRLSRLALQPLLGNKPLTSRVLFSPVEMCISR